MEEEIIAQTKFDQLISDDQSQMLKAFIPYLSPRGQQLLSVFTKTRELSNTLALFRGRQPDMQICSSSVSSPSELLDDLRKFSYGRSRRQLDQISNFLVMMQLIQVMSHSDQEEGDPNDPKLQNIDPSKLALLQNLADQSGGRSPSDMLPFLMSAAAQGRQNGLQFSSDEIGAILNVLKAGKSPKEAAKLDQIVSLMRMIR